MGYYVAVLRYVEIKCHSVGYMAKLYVFGNLDNNVMKIKSLALYGLAILL